jgi:CheY-like chemotaxis protein
MFMADNEFENSYPLNTLSYPIQHASVDTAVVIPGHLETVLLVEDREELREVLGLLVASLGYTVVCAENGADAIAKFQKYQGTIDVLLTDVVMPGMNGVQLAQALCEISPPLKVVFMSGYPGGTLSLEHHRNFLQKPFTTETLGNKLREVIDSVVPAQELH